jgi:predicted anti-sigma-YlaC factor YlaD
MLKLVPPTDCDRAREAISARIDGELAELDAARLEFHLLDCADCRAFAAEAGAVADALRRADLEPVAGTLFTPLARSRRRRVSAPLAAAVASLVVAAAAGSSALVGRLVADRSAGPTAAATTDSSVEVDPAILALLRGDVPRDTGSKSIPV